MNTTTTPPKRNAATIWTIAIVLGLSAGGSLWLVQNLIQKKDAAPTQQADGNPGSYQERRDLQKFAMGELVEVEEEGQGQAPQPRLPQIPAGLGLETPEEENSGQETMPNPLARQNNQAGQADFGQALAQATQATQEEGAAADESQQEGAVALEPPAEPEVETPPPAGRVEKADPREIDITANEGPEKEYEETSLTVQRTLTAILGNDEKQMVRLRVPVMYKSRTLRLEGENLAEAHRIHASLAEKAAELAKLKTEMESLLAAWNKVVEDATPFEALLPESPSLPANQSSSQLNRETNPDMEAGKAISYEILQN
jgi:hypothetical protein